MLALSVPTTSLGKDHGQKGRRNRDNWDWSRRDRKCRKFVNCHDARDGRRDGRGPRADRVGNIDWRNRIRNRDNNRVVWRDRRVRWHR